MSWQATHWVIEHSTHSGSALLTLLCIANCANEDGSDCWPSFERLAKDTRMSKRQLIRIIERLEESGELRVKHSEGRHPNHYSLPQMNSDKMSPLKPKTTVTDLHPNGDISRTNSDIVMSPDPSIERSKNDQKERERPPAQIEVIRALTKRYPPKPIWNDLLTACGAALNSEKLELCFKAWLLRGFNPVNYSWVTDWYVNGIPPSQKNPPLRAINQGGTGRLVI